MRWLFRRRRKRNQDPDSFGHKAEEATAGESGAVLPPTEPEADGDFEPEAKVRRRDEPVAGGFYQTPNRRPVPRRRSTRGRRS